MIIGGPPLIPPWLAAAVISICLLLPLFESLFASPRCSRRKGDDAPLPPLGCYVAKHSGAWRGITLTASEATLALKCML